MIGILAGSAHAATFTVTNTDDNGPGSLRAAIAQTENNLENDTIEFDSAYFSVPRELVLTSGQFTINADNADGVIRTVTILGPGADRLTINANHSSRIFEIAAFGSLNLNGVRLVNGNAPSGYKGGAINSNSGYLGPDIVGLTVSNSILSGNHADYAGAIMAFGAVLNNCAIFGNSANIAGALVITGDSQIINTTIADNETTFDAAINIHYYAIVKFINSAVIFNRSLSTNNQVAGVIGVGSLNINPSIYSINSIFARNESASTVTYDLDIRINTAGNSVIERSIETIIETDLGGNQIAVDPLLSRTMTTDGGVIPGNRPLNGSPVIDAGSDCVLVADGCTPSPVLTDRRGVVRPQDGNGDGTAVTDIGTFEVEPVSPTTDAIVDLQPESDSGVSNTDNITFYTSLSFTVTNVAQNSNIELLRDGVPVASATSAGDSVILVDPLVTQNGYHNYTARETLPGGSSGEGPTTQVTIDTVGPSVTISKAETQADPTRIQPIRFSGQVSEPIDGLDISDISLTGSTANVSEATIQMAQLGLAFSYQVGSVLSSGVVTTSIPSGRFTDIAGNANAATVAPASVTLDLSATPASTCGVFPFRTGTELPISPVTKAVAVGDYDGDGILDIAVITDVRMLSFYRGLGGRKFAAREDMAFPHQWAFSQLFTEDIDGDGKRDLILMARQGFSVFRNTSGGIGTFRFDERYNYGISSNLVVSQALTFADFDGNGRPDLAVYQDGILTTSVYLNASVPGTVSLQWPVNLPGNISTLTTGDLDGDGKPELIASGSKVYQNTSPGPGIASFSGPITFSTPGQEVVGSATSDMDGDGKLDLVFTSGSVLVAVRNTSTGPGSLSFAFYSALDILTSGPLVVQDTDGDGKKDIVLLRKAEDAITVFVNHSTPGTFVFNENPTRFGVGAYTAALLGADLDGDQKPDVLTLDLGSALMSILFNSGSGPGSIRFIARADSTGLTGYRTSSSVYADFDNDGNKDLVAAYPERSKPFSFFKSDGAGGFLPNQPFPVNPSFTFYPSNVVASDFNRDGRIDLVALSRIQISSTLYPSIIYLRNTSSGPGNFSFEPYVPFTPNWLDGRSLAVGDLDGDGFSDLVVFGIPDRTTQVLRNTSSFGGAIQFVQEPSMSRFSSDGTTADLNGDGKPEIVYQADVGFTILINQSTGPGSIAFSEQTLRVDNKIFVRSLLADLNGDGKKDLISNEKYDDLYIFPNTSSGSTVSFGTPTIYRYQGGSPALAYDYDQDGKPDLVQPGGPEKFVRIYRNTSSGGNISLNPPELYTYQGGTPDSYADDVNHDGRTDLIAGLSTLLSYPCSATVPVNSTPFDFDGDGKADISVYRPSTGVWYLQRSSNGFAAYQFGAAGDKLVPADYTGDGKTDLAMWRNGTWFILRSEDLTLSVGYFGVSTDTPAPGDFDADGKADFAVYRPGTQGTFYIQGSSTGFQAVSFGLAGDLPTVADYDGDGKADIAVYRPSTGVWYRINSATGTFYAAQFGQAGDRVAPADYDGDGKADLGVWRESTGLWYVYRSNGAGLIINSFGLAGDIPAPADYDGDGRADFAVYRPSAPQGTYYVLGTSSGFQAFGWGLPGDTPIPNAFIR